jgi:hypothetical protein
MCIFYTVSYDDIYEKCCKKKNLSKKHYYFDELKKKNGI